MTVHRPDGFELHERESEIVAVCSECHARLERHELPEDEHESARIVFRCPEHGVRVTHGVGQPARSSGVSARSRRGKLAPSIKTRR